MRRPWRWTSLAGAAALLALGGAFWLGGAQALPLVDDGAGLMSPAQERRVAEHHAYLLGDHDIDYRVVTGRRLADINKAAVELFERAAAEGRSETGRGLLLLIDADADLVRLEVGYALEGVFPDAFAAYVEHRQMVPFFERGRVADGILATTELIVTRAQNAAANAGFEDELWRAGTGGAGATAPARLDAGARALPRRAATPGALSAGASPLDTLEAYRLAMAARNADPDLPIYTSGTQRMLRGWVVTPAQMDNVARSLGACTQAEVRVDPEGRHAVVRYPPAERQCSPHFFARGPNGWALDLEAMQQVLRFGRTNAWRLAEAEGHAYAFAFNDWRFDTNGFPRSD